MTLQNRNYSLVDQWIMGLNDVVATLFNARTSSKRPNPAENIVEAELDSEERRQIAGLMRVNHVGEVCAQALYQGQALTAKLPKVRKQLEQAAEEEQDHLAWCAKRLAELNSHTSYLNPFWYTGAFAIGAFAGWMSDEISLGFVAETEQQVTAHLEKHLTELPLADEKSQRILKQMQEDESHHATMAIQAGAISLPIPVKIAMRTASKIMTTIAYWV